MQQDICYHLSYTQDWNRAMSIVVLLLPMMVSKYKFLAKIWLMCDSMAFEKAEPLVVSGGAHAWDFSNQISSLMNEVYKIFLGFGQRLVGGWYLGRAVVGSISFQH